MSMNKRDQEQRDFQGEALRGLGFDWEEIRALRRINGTLRAWGEAECNGEIQRDGEDGEGKPRRYWVDGMGNVHRGGLVADRERGALRRWEAILAKHPDLWHHYQTDCRGCAVYVGRKADMPEGCKLESCYTRGVAVW